MSAYLDSNVAYSLLFADARTARALSWLETQFSRPFVGDWAAVELFALVHRQVRSGQLRSEVAHAGLANFVAFQADKAQPVTLSESAGRLAADLARDAALKISAPDALHLACAAEGGHALVTFDQRLAEAARLRGYAFEIP